jgi:electron transport complex protein RnfG
MAAEPADRRGELPRRMLSAGGVLAAFAVVGAGLVALAADATRERIAANERAYLLRSLNEVLPASAYDNDMFTDTLQLTDRELLGSEEPLTAYRARRDGKVVAVIMNVVAPAGYSGPIRLVVGVDAEGTLTGVRVVSHRETPGLGDDIEAERSDWILGFEGLQLDSHPERDWAVRRDGGVFDQFTGATVTPRAVVKAVHNALIYFEANRDYLLERQRKSKKRRLALTVDQAGRGGHPPVSDGDE